MDKRGEVRRDDGGAHAAVATAPGPEEHLRPARGALWAAAARHLADDARERGPLPRGFALQWKHWMQWGGWRYSHPLP